MTEKTPITQEMIATAVAVLAAHHVQCAAPLAEVAAKILEIGARGPRVRSPQDHRRFFGVIRAAFMHWPENHPWQPEDPEHLRAWLLCRAGYKSVTEIPFEDHWPDAMRELATLAAEAALKAAKSHAFVRPHPGGLFVFTPKSLKFEELGQKEFGQIREVVEEVIKCETGREASELLRETGKAA
jgi:hypothetical protein